MLNSFLNCSIFGVLFFSPHFDVLSCVLLSFSHYVLSSFSSPSCHFLLPSVLTSFYFFLCRYSILMLSSLLFFSFVLPLHHAYLLLFTLSGDPLHLPFPCLPYVLLSGVPFLLLAPYSFFTCLTLRSLLTSCNTKKNDEHSSFVPFYPSTLSPHLVVIPKAAMT